MEITSLKFTSGAQSLTIATNKIASSVSMQSDSENIQINSTDNVLTKSVVDFVNNIVENADIFVEVNLKFPELGATVNKTVKNLVSCSSIFNRTFTDVSTLKSYTLITFNKRQTSANHAGGIATHTLPMKFDIMSANTLEMLNLLPKK